MSGSSDRHIRRFENAVASALRGPCRVLVRRQRDEHLDPLLLAVSGGPDSLALLHALVRVVSRISGLRPAPAEAIHVAYFDHRLRDQVETTAERAFVAAQADSLGLRFMTGTADVRAFARRRHLSIEDAARRCRYAFLGETAAALGVRVVATGHTLTDQAETVLIRMIRGTGVTGLGGMDWRGDLPGNSHLELVRPLLGVSREDTRAYCATLGLAPRHDPENDSPQYLRNRVRAEVLPLLSGYNPRIVPALAGLAASAREAQELVRHIAEANWPEVAQVDALGISLSRERLVQLPAAVRAEVLRRAVATTSAEALPPERVHVQALQSLLRGRPGRLVEMPGGVRAEAGRDIIRLSRQLPPADTTPYTAGTTLVAGEWPLAPPGEIRLPGWRAVAEAVSSAEIRLGDSHTAWLRPDVFDAPVVVTGRRPGDCIWPLGMSGEKKLQDLLVDARVPRQARDHVPIVRSAGQIAWVVGVRVAAWAAARAGEPAVQLTFRPASRM